MTDEEQADEELADRLRASVGGLVRAGLGHPEAMPQHRAQTMGFLMREGALTIAELAARRRVRHQTMQTTVVDLEREGLVRREADPRDGRARLVTLTETGLDVLHRELTRRRAVLAGAIAAELDDEERAVLARVPDLLDRLAAHVAGSD